MKKNNTLPYNACAVKSIVSTELCSEICKKNINFEFKKHPTKIHFYI